MWDAGKLLNILKRDVFLFVYVFYQTYDEWKEMLPDFSEYNWVIPDFVWELSEQIDLGNFFIFIFFFTNNNDYIPHIVFHQLYHELQLCLFHLTVLSIFTCR